MCTAQPGTEKAIVGLADDEQRQLAQIERDFLRDDPRLAATLARGGSSHFTASLLRWLLGFIVLIGGILSMTIGQTLIGGLVSVTGLIVMSRAAVTLMTS